MAGKPWEDYAPAGGDATDNAPPSSAVREKAPAALAPVDAIHRIESAGASDRRTGIVNPASGARGSMQVKPATAIEPGFGVKPSNGTPEDDARAGRDYYAALERKYGDSEKAAIAYDWGPANADRWISDGANVTKLPKETRDYVTKFRGMTGSTGLYRPSSGSKPWQDYSATDSAQETSRATARPSGASPAQEPQSLAGFVGGNLAKGVAQTAGPLAEAAQKVTDLPARAGNAVMDLLSGKAFKPTGTPVGQQVKDNLGRRADSALPGRIPPPPAAGRLPLTADRLPVGEQPISDALRKTGAIGQSAEPRTTAQRYGAAALQALPSAALPGAGEGVLGRVLPQLGGALGGQAGQDLGGAGGRLAGTLLGGGAGGLASARPGQLTRPPQSEAARASESSGIPLTLGQKSGSSSLKFLENRLRELFPSKGTAHADEAKQVAAGAARVNELADQLSTQSVADPEAIGNRLRTTYNDTVGKIASAREARASTDYGKVRELAGNKPVIRYSNVTSELKKIIDENRSIPAGDATKIASQAQRMLDRLTDDRIADKPSPILLLSGQPARVPAPPTPAADVTSAMHTRSAWGRAARRTGNIFSDIDPNANQMLARRLFGAINRDFDAASTADTPIAKALKDANQNYAKASKSIGFIEQSALGKLLGKDVTDAAYTGETFSTKAPEAIAKRYLSMQPSQSAQVTAILREHAPQVLQDAKSFVLRNGLEASKSDIPGAPQISFAKFRREMDRVQPKLEEMGFTAKEIRDIKDVTDTMARAGDRTGANPSGTSAALHGIGAADLLMHGQFAAAAATSLAPYVVGKALLTERGRELLRKAYAGGAPAARNAAMGSLRSLYGQGVDGVPQQ